MKQLRIIGIALLALFALGATMASTAAAEEKEGLLPLNVRHFNILIIEKTKAILEGTDKSKITCTQLSGTGEFDKESDTHGKGLLDFHECEAGGFAAFTLGEKETISVKEALILVPILFLICLIDSAALLFGIFVEITPVHIHVKTPGILIEVKGSAIGHILTNGPTKLFGVHFGQKLGVPDVKECKDENGGVKKAELKSTTHPNPAIQAAELVLVLIQFLEAQTLMDKA